MSPAPRGGRVGVAVTAAVAVAVAVAILAGCGGPRSSLNTDASVCFRALAVAGNAVHHKGKLVGVRRVSARDLADHMPEVAQVGPRPVCVVAYQDDFRPGEVTGAQPAASGRYAVVGVTTGTPSLVGARVTDRLPFHFHHRT